MVKPRNRSKITSVIRFVVSLPRRGCIPKPRVAAPLAVAARGAAHPGYTSPNPFYAEGVTHGENDGGWLRVGFLRVEPLQGTLFAYTVPRVRRELRLPPQLPATLGFGMQRFQRKELRLVTYCLALECNAFSVKPLRPRNVELIFEAIPSVPVPAT